MTTNTAAELPDVLGPLADRIRTTLTQNPIRLGVPGDLDDLVSALTVNTAACFGSLLPTGGPHADMLLHYAEQFTIPCPGHPLGAVVYLHRNTQSRRFGIFDGENHAWHAGSWCPYEELTEAELWPISTTDAALTEAFAAGRAKSHLFVSQSLRRDRTSS